MMIGHLPAGFILGKTLQKLMPDYLCRRNIMVVSLIGSILPDLDMIYFYAVDRSISHHLYYSHIPFLFCALIPISFIFLYTKSNKSNGFLILVLWSSLILHAILDTTVEGILWTYPFCERTSSNLINWSDKSTIPHIFEPHDIVWSFGGLKLEGWVINVMAHWTFLLEIATIIISVLVFWFSSRKKKLD